MINMLVSKARKDPMCSCCKESRLKKELKPRFLNIIPISSFDKKEEGEDDFKLFKNHHPLKICTYCDGSLSEILEERGVVAENC